MFDEVTDVNIPLISFVSQEYSTLLANEDNAHVDKFVDHLKAATSHSHQLQWIPEWPTNRKVWSIMNICINAIWVVWEVSSHVLMLGYELGWVQIIVNSLTGWWSVTVMACLSVYLIPEWIWVDSLSTLIMPCFINTTRENVWLLVN